MFITATKIRDTFFSSSFLCYDIGSLSQTVRFPAGMRSGRGDFFLHDGGKMGEVECDDGVR